MKEQGAKEKEKGKKRGGSDNETNSKISQDPLRNCGGSIVRGSLPRTQTKVRDFRRQDTRSGAELVTTRVLTDTPSRRLSQ